jgi:hypothetical protein
MGSRGVIVVVFSAALGLSGCGRGDDERAVGAVTERFLRAVSDGDGERACAQLSDGARQALEQDESKPCPEAARELEGFEPARVARAEVFAVTAKVDLADGDSAFLELTSRGWRLAAAGCRPEGGDAPYQCDVEA